MISFNDRCIVITNRHCWRHSIETKKQTTARSSDEGGRHCNAVVTSVTTQLCSAVRYSGRRNYSPSWRDPRAVEDSLCVCMLHVAATLLLPCLISAFVSTSLSSMLFPTLLLSESSMSDEDRVGLLHSTVWITLLPEITFAPNKALK